MALWDGLLD
jgi:protein phosphatase